MHQFKAYYQIENLIKKFIATYIKVSGTHLEHVLTQIFYLPLKVNIAAGKKPISD